MRKTEQPLRRMDVHGQPVEPITVEEATTVTRPEFPAPYVWPRLVHVMISDSFDVEGMDGLDAKAANGDPLALAYALNFLQSLYRCGYAVVKLPRP